MNTTKYLSMKKNTNHKTKVNELSEILNEKFEKKAKQSIKQGLDICQCLFFPYAKFRMLVFTNSL